MSGGYSISGPVFTPVHCLVAKPVAGCQLRPRRALAEVSPTRRPGRLDEAPGPENGGVLLGGSRGGQAEVTPRSRGSRQHRADVVCRGDDRAGRPRHWDAGDAGSWHFTTALTAGEHLPRRRGASAQDGAVMNGRVLRASADYYPE